MQKIAPYKLSKYDKLILKQFLELNKKSVQAIKEFKDFNKKYKLDDVKNNNKLAKKYKEIHNRYANAYMEVDADNVALALLSKIGKTQNAVLRNYLSDIESINAQYDTNDKTKELSQIYSFIDRVHKNGNVGLPKRLSDRINTTKYLQDVGCDCSHHFNS